MTFLTPRWRSKFTMHIDDGSNWLLTNRKAYDVISRDADLPKPSQDLFSREFLELAKRRLKPGGIFCGFMPLESANTAKQMLAAFHSVFPHGSLWYVSPVSLLVLGSNERLDIDYQMLKARMSEARIKQDLSTVYFDEPNDLVVHIPDGRRRSGALRFRTVTRLRTKRRWASSTFPTSAVQGTSRRCQTTL